MRRTLFIALAVPMFALAAWAESAPLAVTIRFSTFETEDPRVTREISEIDEWYDWEAGTISQKLTDDFWFSVIGLAVEHEESQIPEDEKRKLLNQLSERLDYDPAPLAKRVARLSREQDARLFDAVRGLRPESVIECMAPLGVVVSAEHRHGRHHTEVHFFRVTKIERDRIWMNRWFGSSLVGESEYSYPYTFNISHVVARSSFHGKVLRETLRFINIEPMYSLPHEPRCSVQYAEPEKESHGTSAPETDGPWRAPKTGGVVIFPAE